MTVVTVVPVLTVVTVLKLVTVLTVVTVVPVVTVVTVVTVSVPTQCSTVTGLGTGLSPAGEVLHAPVVAPPLSDASHALVDCPHNLQPEE